MMEFPDFANDNEMGEWFEAHDVSAADLEPADDVVVSRYSYQEWRPAVTGNYDGLPIIVPDDNGYDKETISGG